MVAGADAAPAGARCSTGSRRAPAGRLTAVTGRSGAGKTTLLRLLAGLDVADAGEVLFDGATARSTPSSWRRCAAPDRLSGPGAGAGRLPQRGGERRAGAHLRGSPRGRGRARDAARGLGLAERARQRVARLSAGEAQRVALARALASARGLLIVDEPTSRLDQANARGRRAARAAAADGQTVICATHDPQVIATPTTWLL